MHNILNYKTYLFDMDGTLVVSEKLKGEALVQTCISARGTANINDYKDVMGQSFESVRDHFYQISNITISFENFDKLFEQNYYKLLSTRLNVTPGAEKLIEILKTNQKRLGLVTSANKWMAEEILKNINLTNHFDVLITREDVDNHKPAPDAYIKAMEKLNAISSETLIFEDSYSGVKSGIAAKCDVICISHEFNLSHNFSAAKSVAENFLEFI